MCWAPGRPPNVTIIGMRSPERSCTNCASASWHISSWCRIRRTTALRMLRCSILSCFIPLGVPAATRVCSSDISRRRRNASMDRQIRRPRRGRFPGICDPLTAGYENQGWKDAGDALVYADGSLVKVQGALRASGLRLRRLAAHGGDFRRTRQKRSGGNSPAKAKALFNSFNEAFWDEDSGFYAYALDGDKKKVLTIASNPGHCLWSGIVPADRAGRVVRRLMAPDMWSGWGISTLSADHPAYNPYSYQNGSVWPHDNGIIALGFRRYGFAEEAARVARDVSGAGGYFMQHQMPELYAGLERGPTNFPVQYLGANVPQAWAAGSAFAFCRRSRLPAGCTK